jgi:pyruvate dehydrogenase E2 component (dihydrolipoamide acetyltransferase)
VVGALGDSAPATATGKVQAAPAVRRLARDLGVDITKIPGTGIGGRITARDIQAAAASVPPVVVPEPPVPPVRPVTPKPHGDPTAKTDLWPSTYEGGLPPRRIPTLHRKQTPPIAPGEESLRIPFRGVRRIIAQHLRHSIGHAVHFTIMDDADITALDDQRRRFTEIAREKVTLLPFIASAVCRVLSGREEPKFNRLNSTVDDENQQIIQHRKVHLGIATDTDEGLMVPVIKDADQLGVLELGRRIQELAKKARERNIKRDELVGSTFTISNFGSLHGRYGTPIINYPEACILAVGRAREGVVVRNHMIGVGMLLPLSFSADHRVVDGGTAAQALARIVELLQTPEELLSRS